LLVWGDAFLVLKKLNQHAKFSVTHLYFNDKVPENGSLLSTSTSRSQNKIPYHITAKRMDNTVPFNCGEVQDLIPANRIKNAVLHYKRYKHCKLTAVVQPSVIYYYTSKKKHCYMRKAVPSHQNMACNSTF
jgi:hypothetical protein